MKIKKKISPFALNDFSVYSLCEANLSHQREYVHIHMQGSREMRGGYGELVERQSWLCAGCFA